MSTAFDKRLTVLLKDYGFQLKGKELWTESVGPYPGRFLRNVRGLFDACEQVIPLLYKEERQAFLNRLKG